nr:hypothetical protein [Tanacetum cinerariifolium]
MKRSLTKELFTPFKDPKREFRSSRKHFKTLSLDKSRSPDFDLFSDQKEYSEEEVTEIMEVVLFYNRLDVPTRKILDSKRAIPSKTVADAKVAIQETAKYSQKWHSGTSRTRSTKTSDGLAAIQAQLNNLGREIKKVNEKVYATNVLFCSMDMAYCCDPVRRIKLASALTIVEIDLTWSLNDGNDKVIMWYQEPRFGSEYCLVDLKIFVDLKANRISVQPILVKFLSKEFDNSVLRFSLDFVKSRERFDSFLGFNRRLVKSPGSESRPPMLNKENYVPWSSRLLRYAKSKPNGKLIHNSILNGPYVKKMIPEPGDANRDINITEASHLQTDDELSDKELKQIEADDQAIQTSELTYWL